MSSFLWPTEHFFTWLRTALSISLEVRSCYMTQLWPRWGGQRFQKRARLHPAHTFSLFPFPSRYVNMKVVVEMLFVTARGQTTCGGQLPGKSPQSSLWTAASTPLWCRSDQASGLNRGFVRFPVICCQTCSLIHTIQRTSWQRFGGTAGIEPYIGREADAFLVFCII